MLGEKNEEEIRRIKLYKTCNNCAIIKRISEMLQKK